MEPADFSFKAPALPKGETKDSEAVAIKSNTKVPIPSEVYKEPVWSEKSAKSHVKSSTKVAIPPDTYKEPEWGGIPPPNYSFEVIKQGTVISNIKMEKSHLMIGRLLNCDIVVEHPSASRYHAVVQYCREGSGKPKGFYVFDLGSTHGTFLNKKQIKSRVYYRVEVGHIIKFGGSSRLYVFQGPEEEEMAGDETVKPDQEEVCDWGLGEDADEDDLTENPFALSTENEELYIEDPKKTLRGWFEREGYELEYKVTENELKSFTCTIQLPIDSESGDGFVMVDATVSGKKKEAVAACALEACRTLDRYGLLRQAQHDSRKRKQKDWEGQDYYDSDEDVFLDRTGTIEKKREFRKRYGKHKQSRTHDSIVQELKDVSKEIDEIEEKLRSSQAMVISEDDEKMDPLDSYMSSITASKSNVTLDAVTKSKLRLRLVELKKQKGELEKLESIICPSRMPELMVTKPKNDGAQSKEKATAMELGTYGNVKVMAKSDDAKLFPSGDRESNGVISEARSGISNVCSKEHAIGPEEEVEEVDSPPRKLPSHAASNVACAEPVKKTNVEHILESEDKLEKSAGDNNSKGMPTARRHKKQMKERKDRYGDEEYSVWMPPDNQSGDGTTHLNSKYGY